MTNSERCRTLVCISDANYFFFKGKYPEVSCGDPDKYGVGCGICEWHKWCRAIRQLRRMVKA